MSLDDELTIILTTFPKDGDRLGDIERIKHAFAEAGWTDQRKYRWSGDGKNTFTEVMTGQEWYTKFMAELTKDPGYFDYQLSEVVAAARRAAGLSEVQS